MIQIVCDDENSTINNNTNIDGSFLEISDPKTHFGVVLKSASCFETVQSFSPKNTKTRIGSKIKMFKILSSKHRNQETGLVQKEEWRNIMTLEASEI